MIERRVCRSKATMGMWRLSTRALMHGHVIVLGINGWLNGGAGSGRAPMEQESVDLTVSLGRSTILQTAHFVERPRIFETRLPDFVDHLCGHLLRLAGRVTDNGQYCSTLDAVLMISPHRSASATAAQKRT